MPLDLPEDRTRKVRLPKEDKEISETVRTGALSPDDEVEYGMTLEISPAPGQKAWVRFGAKSQVRDGETSSQARDRLVSYVDRSLDEIVDNGVGS